MTLFGSFNVTELDRKFSTHPRFGVFIKQCTSVFLLENLPNMKKQIYTKFAEDKHNEENCKQGGNQGQMW